MAFEELKAELGSLLSRMNEQPQDAAELELLIREKLNEYRALGMPLPQDLVVLDAALDQGMTADALARGRGGHKGGG